MVPINWTVGIVDIVVVTNSVAVISGVSVVVVTDCEQFAPSKPTLQTHSPEVALQRSVPSGSQGQTDEQCSP